MRTTATFDVPTDERLAPAIRTCRGLYAISEDFQDLLRGHCERCTQGTGACIVERMRSLAEPD